MKLLFFGTRRHGLEALRALIGKGYRLCAVTTEDYDMDEVTSEDFRKVCLERDIPFYKNDNIENEESQNEYSRYGADLGVCVGWRRLIGEKILSTTKNGFIGPHGAELPKYRGFASTHYSILNGDPYCGFSIMLFKAGEADSGDICKRFSIPIDEDTTIKDIHEKSRPLVVSHIIETIEELKNGTLKAEVQDDSKAIYSFPRLPEDGEINWEKSAVEIDRLVRAVTSPYPGAYTHFNGRKMYVWRAHLSNDSLKWVGQPGHIVHTAGEIGVLTGDGILILDECQFADEEETFSPCQKFKTYRLRLGMNYSNEIETLKKRLKDLEAKI